MLHRDWFDNTWSEIEVITSNKYKNSTYLYVTKTSCWKLSCSLFLVKRRSCTYVLSGLSMQYFFMVANIVFLGRSTIVIAIWICFSWSTKSLDRDEVTKFLGVSSVENSLTAWTIGFRKQRSCLKSNTPNFICWCLRKSLLSFFSENFQLDVQILLIVFFDLGSGNFPKTVRIFAKIRIVRTTQFVERWSNIENHLFSVEFEVRASVFETEPGWKDDWSWVYNKLKCFFSFSFAFAFISFLGNLFHIWCL